MQEICNTALTAIGTESKSLVASDPPSFKVGDEVRVYRTIADGEADWWKNDAAHFVGNEFEVSEVLGDSVMVKGNLSRWPTCILEHTTYSPQVGDVVEFEYLGGTAVAVVGPLHGKTAPQALWGMYPGNNMPTWTSIPDKTLRKTDFISGLSDVDSVKKALKAYFSTFSADPDKSYAQNQAAWVKFHGLEVGSEVKVVRKWKEDEGGYNGSAWDYEETKCRMQGGSYKFNYSSCSKKIMLTSDELDYYFPYFALEPVK